MAQNKKYEIDYFGGSGERKPKKKKSGNKRILSNRIFIIVSAAVLVTALVVFIVIFASNQQTNVRIIDFGTAVKGVTVEGIDISKMTKAQALEATANLEKNKLDTAKFTLNINGEPHQYGAADLSVVSDYKDIINKALDYGHKGNFDQRQMEMQKAAKEGMKFTITLSIDENTFQTSLDAVKTAVDKTPKEASAIFMPWGYSLNADGTATAYEPDKDELIKAVANGKKITYPDNLVRLTSDEMPPEIRYQFYQTNKYKKDYIPEAANIARFFYTQEVTGLTADIASVADQIKQQVQSGTYTPIEVPTTVTQPTSKLDQIKQQTHLIVSWTSCYASHYGYNRNWNVAKMSGIICGQIFEPNVQWSINDTAGPRYTSNGWKKASGIVDGGYQDQPGGGVCQISSTLYNATIRCGLTSDNIVSKHHSIISGYIPMGLDATISTGSPDLKITNPYTTPLYVVSYVNPETKSVTVEIYGAPVLDPDTNEEVIYNYDSKSLGSYGDPPIDVYHYDATELPDGTAIDANTDKRYANKQNGRKIQTYKHFLHLDGTEYKKINFENVIIKPINGSIYCNYPESGPVTPTPPPVTPTPPASTEPATGGYNFWGHLGSILPY